MELDDEKQNWSLNADSVQAALRFIKRRGKKGITPELIVEWDRTHGKRLFPWNDAKAAEDHRLHLARVFLNSFGGIFDRMRIKKFKKVPGNEETGRATAAYLDTNTISKDTKLREWAIGDLTRRIIKMTSELRFWKLTVVERTSILRQLEESLRPDSSIAA